MSSHDQVLIDTHLPFEIEKFRNPRSYNIWSNDVMIDWSVNNHQLTQDDTFTSHSLPSNALDTSGVYGTSSVWPIDQLACLSAASASNYWPNDRDFSLLAPFLPSNAAMHLSTPHYATVTPSTPVVNPAPCLVQEIHPVHKQTSGLRGKHASAFRPPAQSITARLRHTPYPLGDNTAGSTSQRSLLPSLFICQWTHGTTPCGASVASTKKAFGQHLHTRHGMRTKPDETVCLWGGCGKYMRKESIARHVLAVHMQDKVDCQDCGSHFARLDSLQRHRRACRFRARGENAAEASGVEEAL